MAVNLTKPKLILLSDEDYEAFVALLDAPVKDMPNLQKLMARPAPWDKEH